LVTIEEFLRARLDEDEAAARAAASRPRGESWGGVVDGTRYTVVAAHIARHDPARVQREIEAKRAILAEHQRAPKPLPGMSWYPCRVCTRDRYPQSWPCATVRALAAVWSDHPDYQQEWAPA
jgi:hypothetical protein